MVFALWDSNYPNLTISLCYDDGGRPQERKPPRPIRRYLFFLLPLARPHSAVKLFLVQRRGEFASIAV